MRDPRYFAGLRERFGFLPRSLQTTGTGAIWLHAVSVGEILSAVELIRVLRKQRPRVPIYVSTATLAGRAMADQKLAGLADGVFFAPLDYRSVIRRVLRGLRPALVVVLETEIWPNLYRESKRAGASLMIVNGRISDHALPRYRRWRFFFRQVLSSADAILVQSDEDRNRFIAAGAPAERVHPAGNLKYDFTPPASIAPEIAGFLDRLNASKIWIAASTMPPMTAGDVDEDDAVIEAFATLGPRSLLILAPRKPERFDVVAKKLERAGIRFIRRSHGLANASLELPGVLLLDSIGELAALFERATVVLMGGTLAARGGHNILEPAYFAKPIVIGPHMENFAAIAKEFLEAHAVMQIDAAGELATAVNRLLDDPGDFGVRARQLAMSKRGVTLRMADAVWSAYDEGVPAPLRTLAARILLTPLTWVWRAGHRVNMGVTARRKLGAPVISVGGLSMGGAGKSPMVAHLASRLREAGRNPAILTRGYKRESKDLVVIPRGGSASVNITGDEAQMFIRRADAHVGIGADRFTTGREIEQELKPDVFLLDDGFQHAALARTHDIVLIDALDPLAGGVFPLGRLREPPKSLASADTIIVTRVERGQNIAGIRRLLARYNAETPVFSARVVAREWVDAATGEIFSAQFSRAGAFCGLGEPRSFWRTLEELGIETAFRSAFRDHQRYGPAEVGRLKENAEAAGVDVLVTTEKDAMNLCDGAALLVAPRRLLYLRIGIEIEREDELLNRITSRNA
ncbi:MAG TPA: tetraacyldisaccharide 4'-kinase [Bryobacteraceae bacterium]|nr:tetraacyldisaccharide 4'-kinase [Bryobacteraceae bacterium]